MAKEVNELTIQIQASKDAAGKVTILETAQIIVSASEYPEFRYNKDIPISLTDTQRATIVNHIKNVVLPQAEIAKETNIE